LAETHSYAANPWSWLILGRPTSFFYETPNGCGASSCSQEILAIGTPILWWAGIFAIALTFGFFVAHRDRISTVILAGIAGTYLPWFLIQGRTTFYFYAISILPFLILALIGVVYIIINYDELTQTTIIYQDGCKEVYDHTQKLLTDKTVKYGQLKRIIHDFQTMDKVAERIKYDLAGGDLMDRWSKQHLQGERDLVSNIKDGRKRADDISSMTGERRNSHLKKHTKKAGWLPPTNLIKSNSHKNSISSIKLTGLFEEVERIKKLME
jgi:hypothetical protein